MTDSDKQIEVYTGRWESSPEFTRFRKELVEAAVAHPDSPTSYERRRVWLDKKCVYCGQPAAAADHVRPKTKGGWDILENLVPACTSCNASKHNKLLTEWRGDRVARAARISEIVFNALVRELAQGHRPPADFFPGWLDMPPLPVPTLAECRAMWLEMRQARRHEWSEPDSAPVVLTYPPGEDGSLEMVYEPPPLSDIINAWLCMSDDTLTRLSRHDRGPFPWTLDGVDIWTVVGWFARSDEGRWQVPLSAPAFGLWERLSWHSPPPGAFQKHYKTGESAADCWHATGSAAEDGGAIGSSKHMDISVRIHLWTMTYGMLPGGVKLWPKCGTRACVNPAHMEPVTWRVYYWRTNGHFWAQEVPGVIEALAEDHVATAYTLMSKQEVFDLTGIDKADLEAALAGEELKSEDPHGGRIHRDALIAFLIRRASEDAGLEVQKALAMQAVTNMALDVARNIVTDASLVLAVTNHLTHQINHDRYEEYTPARVLMAVRKHLPTAVLEHGTATDAETLAGLCLTADKEEFAALNQKFYDESDDVDWGTDTALDEFLGFDKDAETVDVVWVDGDAEPVYVTSPVAEEVVEPAIPWFFNWSPTLSGNTEAALAAAAAPASGLDW